MRELPTGTVTLLFTDIEGSDRLIHELRGDYPALAGEHNQLLREAFRRASGHEVELAGDTFLFAFARARDAIAGAIAAQHTLQEHRWPAGVELLVAVGIHTGEPTVHEGRYMGVDVLRTARICSAADGGQILLSDATRQIVEEELPAGVSLRDLGWHELKGRDRPERLHELVIEALPRPKRPSLRTRALPAGTVTFLFTDIAGSTRLIQQLRERWPAVQAHHHRVLRAAFAETGGREVDAQAEAFFYAFPRARDAVVAAAAGQRALASHSWPDGVQIRVRMGLHTGEPSAGDEGYLGLDVARAARICSAGHGGQVLLSQTTRALIAGDEPDGIGVLDLGEHRLKDLERPERIYQLVIAGLQTSFEPLKTLAGQPAEPPMQLTGRADQLAAQAESAVRDLRVSIEQQVAAELRQAGLPEELVPRMFEKRPASAMAFGGFFLLLAVIVVVTIVYLLVR
jgi:class 3 adenylate cyclase